MREIQRKIQFLFGLGICIAGGLLSHTAFAQDSLQIKKSDSLKYLIVNPYLPNFRVRDRHGDPFSNYTTSSPFFLKDPKSKNVEIAVDTGKHYNIYERMGNVRFRPNSTMSFREYDLQQDRIFRKDYFQNKSLALDGESAVSSRNLIPKLYVSPILDRIFGGSYVELIPKGFVTLDLGGTYQKIQNPAIPIRQQSNGSLEFDQQINLNVTGKIGEKLKVTTNFDTNNSFDFQNNMKVEYTGFKEDLLKKLEIGNVSLPLNNSLITGSQNLFGIKAQMQFGKMMVTAIASTQRGKQSNIRVTGNSSGGASQGRPFEIVGSNYDDNRHFFLSQFFRDNFETWLSRPPQIFSGVNITRIEVYSVNRQNDTQSQRDIVAFMDMGETNKIYNSNITMKAFPGAPSANANNDLFSDILKNNPNGSATTGQDEYLQSKGLIAGTDYEKITSARKLNSTEYTFNAQLGYLTLQRKLQGDEAIAVAYEYTYNGQVFKVGELTEDYSVKGSTDVIYLKMLRPRSNKIKDVAGRILPTWNLMMKNIYNLNVTQLTRDGFQLRVIYKDDRTGKDNPQLQDGTGDTRNKQLIEVFGLDRLNPYNDPQPDGNFDYVDGLTINSTTGLIIFPYLEPFNSGLRKLFAHETEEMRVFLTNKYVYDTLYHTTKAEAELVTTKNKFYLSGSFKAGSGRDIVIQGFNITPGSIKVYAGGTPLREGVDYTVDYTFGKVSILNEGVLSSGKDIDITYEQQDPFAFQTRSLLGTRFDYKLTDDINLGGTFLYYNERPLITRNLIGNEPARNIQYGLDFNMKKDSRLLTKMVDALPFLQTKEKSTITVNAEFAQLLPGTSNTINGDGTSFIDDFENSATPYSLISPQSWKLAAIPKGDLNIKDQSNGASNDIRAGYNRAKLAWYTIDNLFYLSGSSSYKPPNISDEDLKNHYVRAVSPQEIFPKFDPYVGNFYEPILNFAYYPTERGPYNYNKNYNDDDPTQNALLAKDSWAGVTTAIRTNVDFDAANVEYIEFWLMDPFIKSSLGAINDGVFNKSNTTGGKLIFHVGSVSEDVERDGKQAFENGLPRDGNLSTGVTENNLGYVTTQQYLNNAFDNSPDSRKYQDVGLDGIGDDVEQTKFGNLFQGTSVRKDPSADNFHYFLGSDLDNDSKKGTVLGRYKNINGHDGNTPILNSASAYAASGSTIPDNEDINQDNTLTDLEEYYTYNIDLEPSKMVVGNKFIVDKIVPKGASDVTWYLFRIPIRNFDSKVGEINGFKTIKYIRTILTGFTEPVVLRMAKFRSVGQKWRQYAGNLQESALKPVTENVTDNFTVSTVNIEENSSGNNDKPGYIEPLNRDRDVTSTVSRRLNEQSGQLCVTGLNDGDARAMYKNVSMDLFNYQRIKMFISAHGPLVKDNEVKAFLRLGTDFDQNYYEIELPLKITPSNAATSADVWPDQNQIDLDLNDLYALKLKRDREGFSLQIPYPQAGPLQSGKHGLRVMGRPDLSQLKMMMIGVRNPKTSDGRPFDVCIWADELRLTDFDQTPGWAGNLVVNAKLADLGNISGSFRHIGFGYGNVQSKISERARGETNQFDISGNIALDKLLPRKTGLKIPMYFSYESLIIDPKYDPANPDLRIAAVLKSLGTDKERSDYLNLIQDRSYRKSLNFTNVRKTKVNKDAKSHIWDIENFAFTYSFSEATQTNFNLLENTRKNVKGAVAWQYQSKFKGYEPFKNVKIKSKYFQLIKDFNFNPVPSSISVRGELDRSFTKIAYRNYNSDPSSNGQPNYQKYFTFNRYYNITWSITKSLKLDYNATANAIIDEPAGDIDTPEKRDSVINNLKKLGRMKYFEQNFTANYTFPLDKFPVTDWLGGDYRYNVGYNWRAGPLEKDPALRLGNTIQNTRTEALSGKIDMVKLYNKIGFLKNINTPPKPKPPPQKDPKERARLARADTLPHPPDLKAVKGLLRFVMSLRSINGTYTVSQGTILPGFTKTPHLFGLDDSWSAPGTDFILGGQDPFLAQRMADKGWLTHNTSLTAPFSQNETKDLAIRASMEPSTDLKIQLDLKKTSTTSFQEIFRDSTGNGYYTGLSPSRSGSYKISFISIGTSFMNNESLNSDVFNEFKENINTIKNRFNTVNSGYNYENQSQDVLIPAFIAAYSGRPANDVGLSPFPAIPLPNWRLDYNGLNKIGALKDAFTSITLSHAYTSSYSVLNYTNSLQYTTSGNPVARQIMINNPVENYNNNLFASATSSTSNQLIPVYIINQVLISETFAPLIGISAKTKSKLSITFNYKTKRDVSLNVPNAQITEVNGKDWSVELGFTKNNMKLPFKDKGRIITLKNDVTFKMTVGVTSNQTIQRRIDEGSSVTNGNVNFQLRPNLGYTVNKKLQLQMYVEHTTNEPLVSNSYPRTTTKGGFKVIFNLSQ